MRSSESDRGSSGVMLLFDERSSYLANASHEGLSLAGAPILDLGFAI
jgi:hypothetical protein